MPKLLIVDDHDNFTELAAEDFENLGWRVSVAASRKDAMELLEANPRNFDAILLDRALPEEWGGDEILRWLDDKNVLDDVCVVIHTANADLENATAALRMGAWHYVVKPATITDLVRLLAPGIAIKKCHRIRGHVTASDLNIVLKQLAEVFNSTLDCGKDGLFCYFISDGKMIDLSSLAEESTEIREFTRRLVSGEPYVFESGNLSALEPVRASSKCLMAFPVKAERGSPAGTLVMEAGREQGIEPRWREVLSYMADLIGMSLAVAARTEAEARRTRDLALTVREFRHRLSTSVSIIIQRLRHIEAKNGGLVDDYKVVQRHVAYIGTVMDELNVIEITYEERDLRLQICTDVGEIVNSLINDFDISGHNPRIVFQRPRREGTLTPVMIDQAWIEYVLLCILKNAVEAIEDRRLQAWEFRPDNVIIDCQGTAGGVLITIQDSGIGITSEVMARLFLPLFTTKTSGTLMGARRLLDRRGSGAADTDFDVQGDGFDWIESEKRLQPISRETLLSCSQKGEGLGLYSAKRIVEKHGGTLSASSPGDSAGSTFSIWLPTANFGKNLA